MHQASRLLTARIDRWGHGECRRGPEPERQVVANIAMGDSGPATAGSLHVSLASAQTVIRRCLAKLGAVNRPHAVLLALHRREISFCEAGPWLPSAVRLENGPRLV